MRVYGFSDEQLRDHSRQRKNEAALSVDGITTVKTDDGKVLTHMSLAKA